MKRKCRITVLAYTKYGFVVDPVTIGPCPDFNSLVEFRCKENEGLLSKSRFPDVNYIWKKKVFFLLCKELRYMAAV